MKDAMVIASLQAPTTIIQKYFPGWLDGGGSKSRFEDCLQQSKNSIAMFADCYFINTASLSET